MQAHLLNIETGIYKAGSREQRICTVCNISEIEDELHFILQCPVYSELRVQYIKLYYWYYNLVLKM